MPGRLLLTMITRWWLAGAWAYLPVGLGLVFAAFFRYGERRAAGSRVRVERAGEAGR